MRDVSFDEIRIKLDAEQPRWMFELADQRDVIDALDRKCREPGFDVSEFLANRCRAKVHTIARATWLALNS